MVAEFQTTGELPAGQTTQPSLSALTSFLEGSKEGDYIALHAYIQPGEDATEALQALRTALRNKTRLATTLGYGPRFLHSTGQLHKGDRGNGIFIQFTAEDSQDLYIPDEAGKETSSITFGVLKTAQALGDFQALVNAKPPRRVIRIHLGGDPIEKIKTLTKELSS
jgi:hypothetical protein